MIQVPITSSSFKTLLIYIYNTANIFDKIGNINKVYGKLRGAIYNIIPSKFENIE